MITNAIKVGQLILSESAVTGALEFAYSYQQPLASVKLKVPFKEK